MHITQAHVDQVVNDLLSRQDPDLIAMFAKALIRRGAEICFDMVPDSTGELPTMDAIKTWTRDSFGDELDEVIELIGEQILRTNVTVQSVNIQATLAFGDE